MYLLTIRICSPHVNCKCLGNGRCKRTDKKTTDCRNAEFEHSCFHFQFVQYCLRKIEIDFITNIFLQQTLWCCNQLLSLWWFFDFAKLEIKSGAYFSNTLSLFFCQIAKFLKFFFFYIELIFRAKQKQIQAAAGWHLTHCIEYSNETFPLSDTGL